MTYKKTVPFFGPPCICHALSLHAICP